MQSRRWQGWAEITTAQGPSCGCGFGSSASVAMPPQPPKCGYLFPDTQLPPPDGRASPPSAEGPRHARSPSPPLCEPQILPCPRKELRGHRQSLLNMRVPAGLFTEELFRPAAGPSPEPRSGSRCLQQAWNQSACIPATAPARQPQHPPSVLLQLPGGTPLEKAPPFLL